MFVILITNAMVNARIFASYLEGRTSKKENTELMKAVAASNELFSILSVAAAVKSCEVLMDEKGKFIGQDQVQLTRKGGIEKSR